MGKRKIALLAMIIVMLFSNITCIYAKDYGVKASGDYQMAGQRTQGSYTHIIYRAFKDGTFANDFIETDKKLISPVSHTKGSGSLTLTIKISRSASATQTYSWSINKNITSSYGMDLEFFKTSIAYATTCGCGMSSTAGYNFTVGMDISKTISSNAPSAYYSMAPGYTYYNVKDYVINTTTGATDTIYFRMPYGDAVIYTIYSYNNLTYFKY